MVFKPKGFRAKRQRKGRERGITAHTDANPKKTIPCSRNAQHMCDGTLGRPNKPICGRCFEKFVTFVSFDRWSLYHYYKDAEIFAAFVEGRKLPRPSTLAPMKRTGRRPEKKRKELDSLERIEELRKQRRIREEFGLFYMRDEDDAAGNGRPKSQAPPNNASAPGRTDGAMPTGETGLPAGSGMIMAMDPATHEEDGTVPHLFAGGIKIDQNYIAPSCGKETCK